MMGGTRWSVAVACVVLVSLLISPVPGDAQSTAGTTFSGQATAVRATVLGITTVLSDTGPLPESGGARNVSLLEANAGALSVEVLHASTVGQGDRSRSEASVASVALAIEGNNISSDFLQARATAVCGDQGPAVSGGSEIVSLVVNGQAIVVSTAPNQTILLPNGRVVINEQQRSMSGNMGEITVNALHVIVNGIADIVIASAHADVGCAQNICDTSKDFVTGGGWILGTPSGAKANFAVGGGKEPGWGHLTYIEHASSRLRVKGTSVTAYLFLAANARRIEGTAEVNGQSGFTYRVDVTDNGEPGRTDTFALSLSNGYSAGGVLEGGNIQLHTPCK